MSQARRGIWDLMQRRLAVFLAAASLSSFTVEQVIYLSQLATTMAPRLSLAALIRLLPLSSLTCLLACNALLPLAKPFQEQRLSGSRSL